MEGLEIKRQCAHKRCTDRQTLADRQAGGQWVWKQSTDRARRVEIQKLKDNVHLRDRQAVRDTGRQTGGQTVYGMETGMKANNRDIWRVGKNLKDNSRQAGGQTVYGMETGMKANNRGRYGGQRRT